MDWELEMCDRKSKEFFRSKYGFFWKWRLKGDELSEKGWELYNQLQKDKGIVKTEIKDRPIKNLKKRKLLGKGWIKCPNNHESFSEVYEDNGFQYYICGVCGMVVGLPNYNNKAKDGGFTGHNSRNIMEIFRIRGMKDDAVHAKADGGKDDN